MIELWMSSDGKHTVHIDAATVAEADRLLPEALRLYQQIVQASGTKQTMLRSLMTGERDQVTGGQIDNGAATVNSADAPLCKLHKTPMVLQEGRFGAFWSCRQKNELGVWCSFTQPA